MNYLAKIKITLRPGILDVQGKAVEQALNSINFKTMSEVRIGKYVELKVDAVDREEAGSLVDAACNQLIANPIVEDYFIEIEEI
ncbi:MAG: phosphoribosylformylglycinamidine synthase subunit PurS [Chloroflexota bacterium]